MQREESFRYLMSDSSPLKGWNFYVLLQEQVAWPRGMSAERVLAMVPEVRYHSLPLTTFGYGAADTTYKAALCRCPALPLGLCPS